MAIKRSRGRYARISHMRKAGQYLAKAHHVHGSQDASADASSLTQTPNTQHNSKRYADHKAEKTRQSTEQRERCGHNKSCVSPSHTFSGNDVTPLRYVENACCCCSTNQPATALLSAEQTSADHAEEPARVPQEAAIDDALGSKLGDCAPSDMFAAYPKQHYFSAATTGRGCRNMSFAATTAETTIAVPRTKAQIKPDTKTKVDTNAAMCYPADAQTYMASIDSGLGRRHINSIVSTASSGYSWMPAHIPLLDLGMHSAATSAGISQRVLNRAVDSQRKRDRSSRRIQSIAATGASSIATPDGQSHALYLSSDGFAEDSSLDRSDGHKISMVGIGTAPSDPLVVASKPKSSDTKSVRTASGELSGCHGMHESSVVWMHGAYSEKSQGQQGAKTQSDSALAFNETGNDETIQRGVLQGAGTHSGCADTSKYMFFSSRTGAVYGSSLVAPVCGDLGIDSLIDMVLGSDGLEESDNSPSTCFWLDIAGASPQEVADLSDIFELHPLSTQDIVNGCPRDKIDVFDTYAFVVYSSILHGDGSDGGSSSASSSEYGKNSGGVARWAGEPADPRAGRSRKCNVRSGGQICIVMRSNYVVTFHCGHQRSVVRRVLDRLDAMKAALVEDNGEDHSGDIGPMAARTSDAALNGLVDFPAYIVYAVLDEITDQLSPSLLAIEQHVDAIDELVLVLSHNEHENMLCRMGEQRRRILTTWQMTQPKTEIVETLILMLRRGPSGHLAEEVAQYLADVLGHLAAAVAACSRAEAVLSRSHANYLAKISLELSRATFDSNSTTERWTMLGTIVVPINIVTSFLGVNLKVPGQDRDDTLNFFVVMACMVVYAAATLAFWRWRQII